MRKIHILLIMLVCQLISLGSFAQKLSALQVRLQALGSGIPSQLLLMLPYILTVVALIFASKKAEFPSAYTIPYSRMER